MTADVGGSKTFDCDTKGCHQQGPEFCFGCVSEGLPGLSDDCRFENPTGLVYLDHCDTCSCRDRTAQAHTEGFVACATHRATAAARSQS